MARRSLLQVDRVNSRSSLDALVRQLGHEFNDLERLARALTHPSAATGMRPDNQRLEFLGDRVLGLVVAEMLMQHFPDLPEGELAPRFNALVRRESLADVAVELDLGRFLQLGRSEQTSGGRRKAAILADAMEAVIAAIYLDGGLAAAAAFIRRRWDRPLRAVRASPLDAKTRVQEFLQGRGQRPPDYVLVERTGPDHAPIFTIEAQLEDGEAARGTARSKKLAEQEAAAELLARLEGRS